jgi:hypothetical protein
VATMFSASLSVGMMMDSDITKGDT